MDRQRLVHLLGLLGSGSAGERATAGKMAHELVKASGKDWDALIAPATAQEHLELASELVTRGWSVVASCGIAAGLNPPRPGEPLNIGRWEGGRYSQLFDWCSRSNHADITSLQSQLNYLNSNLKGVYSGLAAKLNAAKTVKEATSLFQKYLGESKEALQCKT